MPPRLLAVLLALLLTIPSRAFAAGAPADPDLNPRGRALLAYFQSLSAQPEVRLVSGQFAGWTGGSADLAVLAKIQRATGRWPAMIGLDYCIWQDRTKGPDMPGIDTRATNALASAYWQDGGLVTLSWHAPNPSGRSLKQKGPPLADLLRSGPRHDRWMESLDAIAAGLQELQAAGIVVLWRPLHEMNGGWFWWGAQPPADYIAVWRHMVGYFTREKKLHNLIWVFGPNSGQQPPASYYPGDAYVDLTGLDAYTDDIDADHIQGFPALESLGKPAGFAEFGPHAASAPPGDYDYRRLLEGIGKNFPHARYFLCWDQKWNPAENQYAKEFYNDPRVITRDQIPPGLAGPEEKSKRLTPNPK